MNVHVYMCPVRWSDMDIYGVVNNVQFLQLLEEARVDFIWRLGPTGKDAFFSGGSVVVSHEIRYKNPLIHKHEPVQIEMWVSELASATVRIDYFVKDEEKIYAAASTVMAPYNYEKRRPKRLSDDERSFFEKYLQNRRAL